MNNKFIKRRYFDIRMGITVISPVMTATTLIGVLFLYIQDIIPIYFFVPIFVIGMIGVTSFIGLKFRGIQMSTDQDLIYEKQIELNKTLYQIMLEIGRNSKNCSTEFIERMNEVKKISERKI